MIPFVSESQVGLDSLIQHLRESHFEGVLSGKTHNSKIFKLPQVYNCYDANHHYIWYKNNLVTLIDGSGKLFEYQTDKSFKRLDSTCYDGYNFGAFNFNYQDTLFSLGGYGFWQFNGMLRYFDEKTGGWEVILTDKTVPVMNLIYSKTYYDIADKKIYVAYLNPKQHYENPSIEQDRNMYVQCLDLVSKKWWTEPRICNSVAFGQIAGFLTPGPFHLKEGIYIRYDNNDFIYDFKNNLLKKVNLEKKTQIENRLFQNHEWLLFSKDSSLFFYNPINGFTDTLVLSKSDIIETGIPLYYTKNTTLLFIQNPYVIAGLLGGILIISALISLFILYRKMKKRNEFLLSAHMSNGKKTEGEKVIANHESFRENLTEIEKGLLDILVNNTINNQMTTINEMNQVLGISNKPTKVQNNIRSTTIQIINKKFSVYSALTDDLIEKQRTEFDKRFFEYSIQKKYLNKLK